MPSRSAARVQRQRRRCPRVSPTARRRRRAVDGRSRQRDGREVRDHAELRSPMRVSERQRANDQQRPAWPGNAVTDHGTSIRSSTSSSAARASMPAWIVRSMPAWGLPARYTALAPAASSAAAMSAACSAYSGVARAEAGDRGAGRRNAAAIVRRRRRPGDGRQAGDLEEVLGERDARRERGGRADRRQEHRRALPAGGVAPVDAAAQRLESLGPAMGGERRRSPARARAAASARRRWGTR